MADTEHEFALIVLGKYVLELWRGQMLITAIVGTLVIFYLLYRTARVLLYWIRPSDLQMYCHSMTGSWALVTGASDGIGYAFADRLLSRGFNVLLHGRNPEKLKRVQTELAEKYPKRAIEFVVADASKSDDSYNAVVEKVKKLPGRLTVLINNVGGIPTQPQYCPHVETPHENIDGILNVNIRFMTHLTAALIPTLKENKPSLILNSGSAGALAPLPYIALYAATKAFLNHFTDALRVELKAEGLANIEVMCVMIGNVESAGNKYKIAFTSTAKQCAINCLNRVGTGRAVTFPNIIGAIQGWTMQNLPETVIDKICTAEMGKRLKDTKKNL